MGQSLQNLKANFCGKDELKWNNKKGLLEVLVAAEEEIGHISSP